MKTLIKWFVDTAAKIHWSSIHARFNKGKSYNLTPDDHQYLRETLKKDYYIILTRTNTHMSTYLVAIATWLLMKRWGFWGHALMNVEDKVVHDDDFELQEATGEGVKRNPFEEVFACDAVALLKPKHVELEDWTAIMDAAKAEVGMAYNTLGDMSITNQVNCVEMVRNALKNGVKDYDTKFAYFEGMIAGATNLPPEMFYCCKDFEIVWEVRR